jgi:hypothetical protein
LNNKGSLFKNNEWLLKTLISPFNPHEAPIYGHLGKSITPFISPFISPIRLPSLIESMKKFMGEKGGD